MPRSKASKPRSTRVLTEVREKGVTAAELERARNSEIANLVYGQDSQTNQARTYGWALVTGRSIADVKERAKRLEAVTLADIQDVAQKYLDIKRSVTGQLHPDQQSLGRERQDFRTRSFRHHSLRTHHALAA